MDFVSEGQKSRTLLKACFVAVAVCVSGLLIWRDSQVVALPKLLRIEAAQDGTATLDVAVAHYVTRERGVDQQVDFIGAVHLGEREYFESLNEKFKGYDVVLFELIGDPTKIQMLRADSHTSLLGAVQKRMGEILGLAFQLEVVDYGATNFVHADMTAEEFSGAFQRRGETPLQLLVKLVKLSFDPALKKELESSGYSTQEVEKINPVLILLRGPTEKERKTLKMFMAHGLLASDKVLKVLEGEIGGVIIADRNKVAVEALKKQLSEGKQKIAVYYGVGHLPEMHERLTREIGLTLKGVEWMSAWKLAR